MHSAVEEMLKKYELKTSVDKKNALKEIIQEISLLGLYRSGFYNYAAFYGGTALRIFYGLNRFSEDLDFSLTMENKNFELESHIKFIKEELASFGFDMTVEEKIKNNQSNIKSAFIKGGTEIHLIKISPNSDFISGINKNDQIKIKLELDTNPPLGASYEVKYQLNPIPFSVRLFSESSLFAGKIHAVLCRKWGNRIKGRDFYDYIWYLSRSTKLDIQHFENRMRQSGHWNEDKVLTKYELLELLKEKFETIDFNQAKEDVIPFIKDCRSVELWSKDFFIDISIQNLKIKEI